MTSKSIDTDLLTRFESSINQHVRPGCFPLAVRMVSRNEALPTRTKRPLADFGHEIAICQLFAFARRYGWQLAAGPEDIGCPLALTAFGFKPVTDTFSCGEMCAGMYTESKQAGQKTEEQLPKFSFEEYQYLLTAPIGRAGFKPHLYLIYGNSAQIMRIISACLWKEGGYISSRFSARLDCADICIETMQTEKPQVILPCYGDRVFGQTQDHEMAITIPAGSEEAVIGGFAGTHKGGIRYPIPSHLQYKPKFPDHYYKLFDDWDKNN